MTELKPCPFCGGKPKLNKRWYCTDENGADVHLYGVFCTGCYVMFLENNTEEDAIRLWNRRVSEMTDEDGNRFSEYWDKEHKFVMQKRTIESLWNEANELNPKATRLLKEAYTNGRMTFGTEEYEFGLRWIIEIEKRRKDKEANE